MDNYFTQYKVLNDSLIGNGIIHLNFTQYGNGYGFL